MRPKLLDLFCGAGGATAGYERAGFDVVGVDLAPQPRYPGEFVRGDALEFMAALAEGFGPDQLGDFGAIHASPPCQASTALRALHRDRGYPELIPAVRAALRLAGRPFVIENVQGAALERPTVLCGSSFGLGVRRHRLFESSFPIRQPVCRHREQGRPLAVYGHSGGTSSRTSAERKGTVAEWREAMGIDWMTGKELAQAIPPAYTEYVGGHLMRELGA